MLNDKKYYEVVAKCGHVGRRKYVPIKFAVIASSGKEAAYIARYIPRVKHNDKHAILSVKEISYMRFVEINEVNAKDLYLKCGCKQEQDRMVDLSDRIENENILILDKDEFENLREKAYRHRKQKLMEFYCWEDDDCEYIY